MKKILILLPFLLSNCLGIGVVATSKGGTFLREERSIGRYMDDIAIKTKIKSDLLHKDINKLFANIGVTVHEGRVLLTGEVETPEDAIEAIKIAWNQKGVKEVINELQIIELTPEEKLKNFGSDSWITAQIKAKMLLDKQIRSVNYTIMTLNKTVYIMGIAQNEKELALVENIIKHTRFVQKIVNRATIKTDPRREEYNRPV